MGSRFKVLPLHAGEPIVGADQYVRGIPTDWRARAVRWWSYGGVVRSAQMPSGGAHGHRGEIVKTFSGWGGAVSTAEILDHAQEVREMTGARCVSGYAGAVRSAIAPSYFPTESATHTMPFLPLIRGAWQEALRVGTFTGHWRQYDLQSAYYAALLEGLPDPKSYRVTRVIADDGLFRVKLSAPVPGAPYPFNAESEVLATGWEIRAYALPVVDVITGVRWRSSQDIRPIVDACDMWTFRKRARRCFWGAWASRDAVSCHTKSATWTPLRARPHPTWAHLIMARVRKKVFDVSARAVHIFVDSVITQDVLPTGEEVGTWKLAAEYPHGVNIGGTGKYSSLDSRRWDKWAGVGKADDRRNKAPRP